MTKKRITLLSVLALLVLASTMLVACGGSDAAGSEAGAVSPDRLISDLESEGIDLSLGDKADIRAKVGPSGMLSSEVAAELYVLYGNQKADSSEQQPADENCNTGYRDGDFICNPAGEWILYPLPAEESVDVQPTEETSVNQSSGSSSSDSVLAGTCTEDTPGMTPVFPGTDRQEVPDDFPVETFCIVHGGGVLGSNITLTIGDWEQTFVSDETCDYANESGLCGWWANVPKGTIVTCNACAVGHLYEDPDGEFIAADGVSLQGFLEEIPLPTP